MTNRAPDTLTPAYDWRRDAACLGHGDIFLPPHTETDPSPFQARKLCDRCPVWKACLDSAMTEEGTADQYRRAGVRGGLTPAERAARARNPNPATQTDEDRRQALWDRADALFTTDMSDREISDHLGIPRTTINKRRLAAGLPARAKRLTPQDVLADRTRPIEDGHVEWTARSGQVVLHGRSYTRAQLAFLAAHSRAPKGHVKVTCGRLGCVAAAHLADQAMRNSTAVAA